jgi:hypothetical protein
MTGSAKQSILPLRGEVDCFVASAPRNDGCLGCLKCKSEIETAGALPAREIGAKQNRRSL